MLHWILAAACLLAAPQEARGAGNTPEAPPSTQPTTQPAQPDTSLRKPVQAEILKDLLRQQRPKPIAPEETDEAGQDDGTTTQPIGMRGQPLLLEGSFLVERPGRLVFEEGKPKFIFQSTADGGIPRSVEILPNQLLETMEREAEAGFSQFIISAEVTTYRGKNYLLLRKVLRRVGHGNLGP